MTNAIVTNISSYLASAIEETEGLSEISLNDLDLLTEQISELVGILKDCVPDAEVEAAKAAKAAERQAKFKAASNERRAMQAQLKSWRAAGAAFIGNLNSSNELLNGWYEQALAEGFTTEAPEELQAKAAEAKAEKATKAKGTSGLTYRELQTVLKDLGYTGKRNAARDVLEAAYFELTKPKAVEPKPAETKAEVVEIKPKATKAAAKAQTQGATLVEAKPAAEPARASIKAKQGGQALPNSRSPLTNFRPAVKVAVAPIAVKLSAHRDS